MKVEIKTFEEKDRDELRSIYNIVRQTNFIWLEQKSHHSSFDKDTEGEHILVARVNNKIVGFASVWLQDNFLHHLYILNSFQRKGIGTILMKKVFEMIEGVRVSLKCLVNNKVAVNFYLKNNWIPTSIGHSEDGEYILFEYRLAKN